MKQETPLTLTGYHYKLRFTEIKRKNTTRRVDGGHDCREEDPAYVWIGNLEIFDSYRTKNTTLPFSTEIFWPHHVKGLLLEDVLFLCVSRNLFGIEFKNEVAKKAVVDYLATKLLIATAFSYCDHPGSIKQFNIRVFDFRYDHADKSLLDLGLITHDRLETKHGNPGRIAESEFAAKLS